MKLLLRTCVVTLVFLLTTIGTDAQGVGIGIPAPDSSANLDVFSTSKGLLLPRMTTAQRMAIVKPAASLIVFQTDAAAGFYYYNGSQWVDFTRTPVGADGYYAGTVFTLAGSGIAGSTDATGTAASFFRPRSVAVDGVGNVYVADQTNNKIRKVTPFGIVTTVAGSGAAGSNDAFGTAATFNSPAGIDLDGFGNIYIADKGNNKIRKITPGGAVTTLAGSGTAGSADATGALASFAGPTGVVADASGNVYVADQSNNKIRKITVTGVVTSYAGNGTSGDIDGTGTGAYFDHPTGITIDGAGNLYVSDNYNNKIKKVAAGGIVTTVAGSGSVGDMDNINSRIATFNAPEGLAVDASGNVYVADYTQKIRKISATTGVTTLAGNGITGSVNGAGAAATFNFPSGAAVYGNYLYIGDLNNNLIRKIIIN